MRTWENDPFITKTGILKKARFTNVCSSQMTSFYVKKLLDLLKRHNVSFVTDSCVKICFGCWPYSICICKSFTFRSLFG